MSYWNRQYRNERYSYERCIAKDLQRCKDLTVDGLVMPLSLGHADPRSGAYAVAMRVNRIQRDERHRGRLTGLVLSAERSSG